MMKTFLALSALAASAFATSQTHYVTVGGLNRDGTPNLNFYPNDIKAAVGDKVLFTLYVFRCSCLLHWLMFATAK